MSWNKKKKLKKKKWRRGSVSRTRGTEDGQVNTQKNSLLVTRGSPPAPLLLGPSPPTTCCYQQQQQRPTNQQTHKKKSWIINRNEARRDERGWCRGRQTRQDFFFLNKIFYLKKCDHFVCFFVCGLRLVGSFKEFCGRKNCDWLDAPRGEFCWCRFCHPRCR